MLQTYIMESCSVLCIQCQSAPARLTHIILYEVGNKKIVDGDRAHEKPICPGAWLAEAGNATAITPSAAEDALQ